ncbi:hypothetical protein BGZ47_002885 [Haplosporangium gracile]|nr:hypothetical protein BGZ47_002885 [Haplosporangium gracile]
MSPEPWSPHITQRLLSIHPDNPQHTYYGPYNTILASVFSASDGYMVSPQVYLPDSNTAIDPPIEFIVELTQDATPVMALQVKRAYYYYTPYSRFEADQHVRDSLRQMRPKIQTTRFHFVSVLGTRCCIYLCETATGRVVPERIRSTDFSIQQDLAPAARWSIDISTFEGRRDLNNLFDAVKANCASLLIQIDK